MRLSLWAASFAVLAGCAGAPDALDAKGSQFLFVWSGDKDKVRVRFSLMSVVDLREGSATYGDVVATAPIGATGTMPHHVEYEFPAGGMLFGDGFTRESHVADRPARSAEAEAGGAVQGHGRRLRFRTAMRGSTTAMCW
jgi:hypothetical protein